MKASELEMKMERMGKLLAIFDTTLIARRGIAADRMEQFLTYYGQFRLDRARSSSPSFNAVEQSGLYANERQHSAILAWLLDEAGSHGQGSAFLRAFADLCKLPLESDLTDYTVRTEFPGFKSIADIVIFRKGDFLICIENKVFSGEGKEQLVRQESDMRRWAGALQIPESRCCHIFLTRHGGAPVTGDIKKWCPVSYARLAERLESAADQISDAKLRFFVQDWSAVLASFT
jgi:hypothetical protein